MQFLFPSVLWALFAIGIPILIHLFHFRRFKTVYFSNISFLKEVKEETSNRNKLRNILVLISRILAIIFLVLAFSQPYIPVGEEVKKGNKAVSIYVDNSFSMNGRTEDISIFEKAKLDAIKVIEAYEGLDQFQILSNDQNVLNQRWLNKDDAIKLVEELTISHRVADLATIHGRQKEAFSQSLNENFNIYWLSDFQKTIMNLESSDIDTLFDYNIIQYSGIQEGNIGIDTCWWVAPIPVKGQQGSLIVKVHNYNSQAIEGLAVNLNYNGQNFPLGKIDIEPGSFAIDTLKFSLNDGGWNNARVEISDYPIRFDDVFWIAFEVAESLPVLVVSEGSTAEYIKAVFASSSIFMPEYFNISSVPYSGLGKYRMVLLENVIQLNSGFSSILKDYIEAGGNVMLFPSEKADIQNINAFFQQLGSRQFRNSELREMTAGKINEEEFVFQGVFENSREDIILPSTQHRYIFETSSLKAGRKVLSYTDGKSFIEAYEIGSGNLFVSAASINPTINSLVKNAEIFVPMLYKMTLSSNVKDKLSYTLGKDRFVNVNRKAENSEIPYAISGEIEFLPTMRNIGSVAQLDIHDQIEKDGIYTLKHEGIDIKKLAFNYDRSESNPECLSKDEILVLMENKAKFFDPEQAGVNLTQSIIDKEKGIILWKWFIILALAFLAIEILLLRFIKI